MKHFYLIMLALGLSASAASAETHNYVREINSENGFETYLYSYTETGKLAEGVHMTAEQPEFNSRYTFEYDAAGRPVAQHYYQNLQNTENPEEYVAVSQIAYVYDAAGCLTERTVYSLYNGEPTEPELGSVYRLTYTAAGVLDKVEVFPAHSPETASQTTYYTYDAKGRITAKDSYMALYGPTQLATRTTYSYNAKTDRLEQEILYTYYPGENRLGIDLYVDYVFNDDGSMKSIDEYNNTRLMLLQQHLYLYDDNKTIENPVYPLDIEEELLGVQVSVYELTAKPMTGYELRNFNEYSGLVELYDTCYYTWLDQPSTPKVPGGIADINADSDNALRVKVEGNRLLFAGAEAGAAAQIVNAAGAVVRTSKASVAIDLTGLAAGVYVVTSGGRSAKFAISAY